MESKYVLSLSDVDGMHEMTTSQSMHGVADDWIDGNDDNGKARRKDIKPYQTTF